MYRSKNLLFCLAITAWLFSACKHNDETATPISTNAAITTVVLQLTNQGNPADVRTATIDKLNATPDLSKATLTLAVNTTYLGVILLSDKSKNPATDVSAAIRKDQNNYLFIYTPTPSNFLTLFINDHDTNPTPYPVGLPVGLEFTLYTSTNPVTGKLNVLLRHQPGTKDGTGTSGTTDMNTTFDVTVK